MDILGASALTAPTIKPVPAAVVHSRAADSLASETEALVARELVEFEADTYDVGVEIEYRGDAALGAYAGVLTAMTAEE